MRKDPRLFLAKILECIERITQYTSSGKADFLSNIMIQDAVIRNLEIIGEASKRVESDYKSAHPEIPWRDIVAARNRLIHGYFSIDRDIVWHTITTDIPPLITALDAIRDSE